MDLQGLASSRWSPPHELPHLPSWGRTFLSSLSAAASSPDCPDHCRRIRHAACALRSRLHQPEGYALHGVLSGQPHGGLLGHGSIGEDHGFWWRRSNERSCDPDRAADSAGLDRCAKGLEAALDLINIAVHRRAGGCLSVRSNPGRDEARDGFSV